MNFYCITFRLDSDKKSERRYWEDFSSSRDDAISSLCDYAKFTFGDLFSQIFIVNISEYKSVFK